ncbi:CPBP family intramembrane metalloprotease [Candidatus Pacearchaeota archaeon]|nr:CPBP family intramembrane metalloprotease [Candidatus Pacearchaeota archaeon]
MVFENILEFTQKIEPVWTIILVPVWQELVFRYLPYKFWYLPSGNILLVGIVSSIVFALIHLYFGKWFVLLAFFAGLLYWVIMVKFGFIYAILAHSAINIIDLSFGIRYYVMNL